MVSSGGGLQYVYKLHPIHQRRLPCVLTSSIHVTKGVGPPKVCKQGQKGADGQRQADKWWTGGRRNESGHLPGVYVNGRATGGLNIITGGRLQRLWENPNSQLRTGGRPAGYGDSRAGAGLRKHVLLREREDRRAAVASRRAPAGTPWV